MTSAFISEDEFSQLARAFLSLKSESEVKSFLTDLCTVKEIQEISMRLSVARELYHGKNYVEISEKMGASSATISRVSRSLRYGNNGYRLALRRLDEEEAEKRIGACSNGFGVTE